VTKETDVTKHHIHPPPTLRQLIKATGIAMVAASAVLITAVLPAEFGIDPTGMGSALGLLAMKPASAEATTAPIAPAQSAAPSAAAPAIPVRGDIPLRGDEMSVTLRPGEGAEIKATMRRGEQFAFQWVTEGGPVNFDMHGEKFNAGDEFISYKKGSKQTEDQGTFIAPFDGTHGWFWRNRGDTAVAVSVKVSGSYEKLARMK